MNIHHLELFYYVARHGGICDAARNILFVAKQPFSLAPDSKRGSVLIKSARSKELRFQEASQCSKPTLCWR